jgi:3-hydroxyacyl-CoA dehydrogenase
MVAERRLGKKVGRGFYRHGGRRKALDGGLGRLTRRLGIRPLRTPPQRGVLQERLVLAMLNEATRALEEGIVRSPGEADLALVLGTGFPPFRGGLFAFGSTLGVDAVLRSLERLESAHGGRFRPAPLVLALEKAGKGFLEARQVLR